MITYQENTTIYQPYMLLEKSFSYQENVLKDDISRSVIEVVGGLKLSEIINFKKHHGNSYDPVMMLTLVLLAYAEDGKMTLRSLERKCRYDMRYNTIAQGQVPSYKSFQRFINDQLKVSIDELFKQIYLYIQDQQAMEEAILYIDGTKFEANANKMTFFWRGWLKRYKPGHWKKCIEIIRQINRYFKKEEIDIRYSILKEPDIDYLIMIDEALEKYIEQKGLIRKRRGKHELAKLCDELKKSAVNMWKYAMANDILGERNSFSKTDPDATFMHMKYDYYNNTNVFKPGYNVQAGTVNGYIAYMYISANPNDLKTYQPFLNGYHKQYDEYPKVMVGDAGYGSYDNYVFSKTKGIEAVLKYPGYEKKKEKVNDKNRYRLLHFERLDDGTPVCPQGHPFEIQEVKTTHNELVPRVSIHYRNENCEACPVRTKCCKGKNGRTAQITPLLQREHNRIDELLETDRGKQLMRNRSAQAEGVFADIKQDFQYTRLQRRGESGVDVELKLIGIGYNLRKYHNKKAEKRKPQQILS